MKILICIKQVPDPEGIITIGESASWIDFEGPYRMNRFDEFALEEALRIREQISVESIDALSVGPARAESTIRKALETGASRGIHILTEDSDDISAFETASLIASHCRKESYDLILAGVMAEDDMRSQVGQMIAEMLGYPSASSVIYEEIDPEKGTLFAEREIEAGKRECLEMKLPALLTIQSGINRPRYPALSNVLRARKQEITTIPSHTLHKPEKRERIVTLQYPEATSKGIFLEGDVKEKARALIQILHERSII
ncbi:MAG: electron transfer flavoprotein subunit beta/FixA family protein [Thermodesulfobacteriota bacterium]|nr:electron transfer flavoprotein subunit beta/FixA family protein [Thermodesulfobacteriota bacterium]